MSIVIDTSVHKLELARREKYQKAAERIQQWAREDPEYDNRVGDVLDRELKDSGLHCEDGDEPCP